MEVVYADVTGSTTYGMVFRMSDGQVWDTVAAAFEAYAAGDIANYDIIGAEKGASGIFGLTFPSIPGAGGYKAIIKRRIGGAPAESDPIVWEETVWWTGVSVTTPPPAGGAPEQVTGYLYTYDEEGVIEAAVEVRSKVKEMTAITDTQSDLLHGFALDETVRTEVSDGTGLVSFSGLFKGVTYSFWRSSSDSGGREFTVTIPEDAADPYELPSIIGLP